MAKDHLSDFLAKKGGTKDFFSLSFLEKEDRKKAVLNASKRPIHPVVLTVLKELNSGICPEVDKSLDKISKKGAVAVVTGQQLGFLGGPLHTLYKVLTAVKYAAFLEEETGVTTVPIFWLQSEDHDFEEISEAVLFSQEEKLNKFKIDKDNAGDSVGLLEITEQDRKTALDALSSLPVQDSKVKELLNKAYEPGISFSESYKRMIHGVLSSLGLLIFDPLRVDIKEQMKEFIVTSFVRANTISELLYDRSKDLEGKGYESQVRIREKSPLFFLQTEGRRTRLSENKNGDWESGDLKITKEELLKLIDESPEKFTTSALIRPIFQDRLLPTAAYITGPSEFKYWTQITPLYPFLNAEMPLLVPRARFYILEKTYKRLMDKLNLDYTDIATGLDTFLEKRVAEAGFVNPFDILIKDVEARIEQDREAILLADGALKPLVDKTIKSVGNNLGKLQNKYQNALKRKDTDGSSQFIRLSSRLFPEGKNQEAFISFVYYLNKYGFNFLDQTFSSIEIESLGKIKSINLE